MKTEIFPEAFIKLTIELFLKLNIKTNIKLSKQESTIVKDNYKILLILSDFIYLSENEIRKEMLDEEFSNNFSYALHLCITQINYSYTYDFFMNEIFNFLNYLDNNLSENSIDFILYNYINKKIQNDLRTITNDITIHSEIAYETKAYMLTVKTTINDLLNNYKIIYN